LVVDHVVPLKCRVADAPSNMQEQATAEARAKHRIETMAAEKRKGTIRARPCFASIVDRLYPERCVHRVTAKKLMMIRATLAPAGLLRMHSTKYGDS
jgi:hypothetical protein